MGSPPLRISQEAAWLQFNRRVLLQTERPDFPVLERLRFLAIWAANFDEFFSARISRAFLQERGSRSYKALLQEAKSQADLAEDLYPRFLGELEPLGVRVLPPGQLSKAELRYFGAYLAEEVAPKTDLIQPGAVFRQRRGPAAKPDPPPREHPPPAADPRAGG